MEYMLLINLDADYTPAGPDDPGFEEAMAGWFAYNKTLVDGGHLISGGSLQPSSTATVVDTATGSVTDGPFTETKEQVAGFYVIRAADLDEALALTRQMPVSASVEVRPLVFRPDA